MPHPACRTERKQMSSTKTPHRPRLAQAVLGTGTLAFAISGIAQVFQPVIPKAWDDHEVAGFEVPLAQADRSPRYLSEAEYYALEVPPIYRGYPVYAAGKAPPGYLESLRQKEPEIIFDAARMKSREGW